jgi:hypothetical protein
MLEEAVGSIGPTRVVIFELTGGDAGPVHAAEQPQEADRGRHPCRLGDRAVEEAGLGSPLSADQAIDKNAYVFCVLTEFHRHLKCRDIYAEASCRWRAPRAQLLGGEAWASAMDAVLTAIGLPEDPDDLFAAHADTLDEAYRDVGGRLAASTEVSADTDGRLHVSTLKAVPNRSASSSCANGWRRCCRGWTCPR